MWWRTKPLRLCWKQETTTSRRRRRKSVSIGVAKSRHSQHRNIDRHPRRWRWRRREVARTIVDLGCARRDAQTSRRRRNYNAVISDDDKRTSDDENWFVRKTNYQCDGSDVRTPLQTRHATLEQRDVSETVARTDRGFETGATVGSSFRGSRARRRLLQEPVRHRRIAGSPNGSSEKTRCYLLHTSGAGRTYFKTKTNDWTVSEQF